MEVIKRVPEPVTPPPPTYDIVGLTRVELAALNQLVQRGYFDERTPVVGVHDDLRAAITGAAIDFGVI